MTFTRSPVARAVSLSLLGVIGAAQAQTPAEAPAKAADQAATAEVVVTGIRGSIEKSISTKRLADTNVEVVSAEDVGKMPDKNIADALSRLPGVNVQFGGALAMDEAERVSIRGTSPNLNLITVNGHALSSGDWHVGDQQGSGRSVGFGLLPSQLIGQSIVYKTGRADITEGGISGSVDVLMRKPLEFRNRINGEVSLGAVHATLPNKTDPQASGLVAWKNEANTLGVLVQAFREDRSLRRDGLETFSYGIISSAQATASGNPALAGKRMPGSLNVAMFEGTRKRTGGYLGIQFRPNSTFEANLSAFYAKLKADNYNSSGFALPTGLVAQGWLIRDAVIDGDVITSARLVAPATPTHASGQAIGFEFDHNLRKGAESLSRFEDLDFKWSATDNITLKARIGSTKGSGETKEQPSLFFGIVNPNMTYAVHSGRPPDFQITNRNTGAPIDLGNPANYVQMGNPPAAVWSSDKEKYLHLDGDWRLSDTGFTYLKFGFRANQHDRNLRVVSARWNAQDNGDTIVTPSPVIGIGNGSLVPFVNPADVPAPATGYPGNWGSDLEGTFPRNLFRYSPEQLIAFNERYVNFDPRNFNLTPAYTVVEKTQAAYVMTEFEFGKLSGNVGARLVSTKVSSLAYQSLAAVTGCGALNPACPVPGAIIGSRLGTWLAQPVETKHNDVLPSLNLRYDINSSLVARAALTRTLGRANYNELAAAVNLNNSLLTGTSGNPQLKPVLSDNLDLNLAWYYAPRAYVSAGVFTQRLKNYIKAGTSQVQFFNTLTNAPSIYTVTSRIGVDARLHGAEVAAEVPLGAGFGIGANATYVDSKDQDGVQMLGTSKGTYNVRAFFENDTFRASLAWNYRTDYAIGFVGNGTNTPGNGLHKYRGYGTLAASLGFNVTKDISLHLDGTNLLDPVRGTYAITENAPGYWHQSGRQYYLSARMKF